MQRFLNMPLSCLWQKLFVVALSLASAFVCADGSLSPVANLDEQKEVPGYIIVAVIFNISLVIVILFYLKKEWNKTKVVPKADANTEGGEK